MRYVSKAALRADICTAHDALVKLLDRIPAGRYRAPGVWGDDWSLADLVAHLAEWQAMFLGWYDAGRTGDAVVLPAPGYKWSETPRLNRTIWGKHRRRSARASRAEFERGYERILALVDAATEDQLFSPGYFPWTGQNPLTTYLGANSASHYRFARKMIDRWRRRGAADGSTGPRPNER